MQSQVKLFVIPAARAPAGPAEPARDIVVEAPTRDQLWEAARERVATEGYLVRTVSFGPDGLVVYAEERP
ncbi:MAG: hypothetical protein RBU30_21165 [Polyangia bacterium]|jgi:hypothetical protein|nr:hypothetical protein [Polyangia bacterium]